MNAGHKHINDCARTAISTELEHISTTKVSAIEAQLHCTSLQMDDCAGLCSVVGRSDLDDEEPCSALV